MACSFRHQKDGLVDVNALIDSNKSVKVGVVSILFPLSFESVSLMECEGESFFLRNNKGLGVLSMELGMKEGRCLTRVS